MASVGHIMQLKDDQSSYKNTGIYVDNSFDLNLKVAADKHDVINKLQVQAQAADYVVLMTDPDREGFVISWSLAKFLNLPKDKYFRAVTHEITPKAVVAALENPVPMDMNLIDAGLSRLTLDKLLGYSLSPLAKTYIGAKSVGRCQSVGLKLVVDREKEIQNFVPEQYYNLYLNFEKNNTKFKAKYIGTAEEPVDKITKKEQVDYILSQCIKDYIIENIAKKEKQESPKPPFTTSTFQQEASKKLGLSVKDAMSLVQKLFEAGFCTYLRTDSDNISEEFIPELKKYIAATYGKDAFNKPRVGKKTGSEQNGHECLRITDPELTPEKFNAKVPNLLQQKVYKLIWQRTIGACLPNAVFSETTYLIDNNKQKFSLVSNELIFEGFKKVYSFKEDDNTDDGPVKETFAKGEKLQNCKLDPQLKQTTPPARFSESSLVKTLEQNGCGRPSTFATIVETVLSESRGYAKLENKQIVPTERGVQLSNFLDRAFSNIINLNYSKQMEEELDKIAEGKLSKLEFLTNFYNNLENSIKNNPEIGYQADEKICPKCGSKMILRRSKFGKIFYGCSSYPRCTQIENVK